MRASLETPHFGCWGLLVMLLSAGCGATQLYQGARLPPEQVVSVQRDSTIMIPTGSVTIAIERIDGNQVSGMPATLEVLPGPHSIQIQLVSTRPAILALIAAPFKKPSAVMSNVVTFVGLAGHKYELDGAVVPHEKYELWTVWVEDSESGEVVGGFRPTSETSPKTPP